MGGRNGRNGLRRNSGCYVMYERQIKKKLKFSLKNTNKTNFKNKTLYTPVCRELRIWGHYLFLNPV